MSSEFNYVRVGRVEFKKTLDGDWGWWVDGTWYDDEPTLEDAKRAASFAMLAYRLHRVKGFMMRDRFETSTAKE